MVVKSPKCATPSVFSRAAEVFEGWTDPETGLRLLCLHARGPEDTGEIWCTPYHQHPCFLEGGRKVFLHSAKVKTCSTMFDSATGKAEVISDPGRRPDRVSLLLDLTTGKAEYPFPAGCSVGEVRDGTELASLTVKEGERPRSAIWDMKARRELASISPADGWMDGGMVFLGDDRRAIVMHFRGMKHREYGQSRHYLLSAGEPPRLVLEAEGAHCNHMQGCPTDPNLYTYDRWPAPSRDVEQVIYLHTLDGKLDEPVPLDKNALRPPDLHGCRDHYVWTPDGRRIVSYLRIQPSRLGPDFNHLKLEWWLSALDWRTGEDLSAKYPPGRWGGHMQMSPDSRYIVCGGGPGFDKLFVIDMEGLRKGWNERVLCSFPKTVSEGNNADPFPYPFVLPDQSGVVFNAGWPGPKHGVYLAEWPWDAS